MLMIIIIVIIIIIIIILHNKKNYYHYLSGGLLITKASVYMNGLGADQMMFGGGVRHFLPCLQ